MTVRKDTLLNLLTGAAFIVCSMTALAMPKAAEHADAPVTMGADVPKPKRSGKKAEKPVAKKAKHPKKSKTTRQR